MLEFLTQTYYGNPLSEWVIALLLALGAVLVARGLYWVLGNWVKRLVRRTQNQVDDVVVDIMEEPIVFLVALIGARLSLARLTLAADWVFALDSAFYMVVSLGVAWMLVRLYQAFHEGYLVPMARRSETSFDDQVLPTLRSGVSIILWTLGVLVGLNNAGYDVGALLAGLGIGGLAFALAAQDTVANIFGGITIFLQKPFKMGDLIEFEGKWLEVKEIGLRATRLENFDTGHAVYVPNSTFTGGAIVNISAEAGIWVERTLKLAPDTSAAQMQAALTLIRTLVEGHPDVDRVLLRFNTFDNHALEVFLVYHVRRFADRWRVINDINLTLLTEFERHRLRLALPVMVVQGARPQPAPDGARPQ